MIEQHALSLLQGARIVGLGSGRAAERFIRALATHSEPVACVPTSEATASLARSLGLQLLAAQPVDVTFDGADEVDPQLSLIKGYGGALLREKVVARASRRLVIMVSEEKLVSTLGQRGRLPIEVVPFAMPLVMSALSALGPTLRSVEGRTFVSDNGNHILDCVPHAALTPELDRTLRELPGVVATGLFFGLATTVLVERPGGVQVITRGP
jgi:ribose 5-phosphate isomerase A